MLLETKRGKENKVTVPVGTEDCVGNHTWSRDAGYQSTTYEHQDFPKAMYKKRDVAEPIVITLLNDLYGVEDEDDRNSIYLQAMQQVGESGIDIRQWPLTPSSDARLKAMQSVLKLHARDQMRDGWLALNPNKTPLDYKNYITSPETVTVNNQVEEDEKTLEGWCLTPECEQVVTE